MGKVYTIIEAEKGKALMRIIIFGLTITSSWGNGHATIWRGLCRALHKRGHNIVFFEKNVSYYADNRDLTEFEGADIILYNDWSEIISYAGKALLNADVGLVSSYCPDGVAASELVNNSNASVKIFYDLDTPITLKTLSEKGAVPYIGKRGLQDFDLVLSYTGGDAITGLKNKLKAKNAVPLYGCADPDFHYPVPFSKDYRADFSYLGTYAPDRQQALMEFFIKPAKQMPHKKFLIGGSQYPEDFPWAENIHFIDHVRPPEHPAFYCSSPFTLNITRGTMAQMGYSPSGRLFEAASCGVPIISDYWTGIEKFFTPGSEIIIVKKSEDVIEALNMLDDNRIKISERAREKVLSEHTAEHRAAEFENILSACFQSVKE